MAFLRRCLQEVRARAMQEGAVLPDSESSDALPLSVELIPPPTVAPRASKRSEHLLGSTQIGRISYSLLAVDRQVAVATLS